MQLSPEEPCRGKSTDIWSKAVAKWATAAPGGGKGFATQKVHSVEKKKRTATQNERQEQRSLRPVSVSRPHFGGRLDDEPELGDLLVNGDHVTLDRARKAALGTQA
jgi:hypothetical protein